MESGDSRETANQRVWQAGVDALGYPGSWATDEAEIVVIEKFLQTETEIEK